MAIRANTNFSDELMSDTDRLLLIDGSNYLFRAFHALPALTNAAGEPTGAILGVTNMIRGLLAEFQPRRAAVIFDAKGPTFRSALYPEYKAHRPPMPPELAQQIPLVHEIVQALGLPLLSQAGVEADDVIGTLARQAEALDWEVLIFSGDKDMAQLVNDRIRLVNEKKDGKVILDPAGVEDKFGVEPGLIIDYLSLMGDSADNVPGVPKVGPKTAAKWLNQYGSLDALIAAADKVKGKVGENLRAALEQLPLARQLVTIKTDVELAESPQTLSLREPQTDTLRALYQQLGFRRLLDELKQGGTATAESSPAEAQAGEYHTLLDEKAFAALLERLRTAPLIAVDTETDSLDYMNARLVGLSFALQAGEGFYIPLHHDYPGAPPQLPRERVIEALRPILENPAIGKIGQHIKFDQHILHNPANGGIRLQGVRYDTLMQSYVLDSTQRHDMDSQAARELHIKTVKFEDIAGKGAKQLSFNQIPLEQAGPYAAEDADITWRLHQAHWPKLQAQPRLLEVFEQIEMPLTEVLWAMEEQGVLVDAKLLQTQSQELAGRLHAIEQAAHELAGERFNLGSTKQLQAILFDKLGLPVLSKTPKGQPSTAESVLQELALDYELPRLLMEHRSLSKLKSTYTDKLPQQINPHTGRVHTSYHQANAATGRLSSSDPNLQNIPIRTGEGRRIRQAFVAAPGHVLLAADYSQIELRIMAHLSGDENLLRAFAQGEDIHRATAAEVFGVALEAVDASQRRSAKAINFGLIYGMSAFGLAKQLGISRAIAQDYVDMYFARYPGVKAYMDDTRVRAAEQGYVETVFGRRLYLPEIKARNAQRRQYAERTAINAPMQGTAADIIKRAMIAVYDWIRQDAPDVKMIMQVHDELVFEIPSARLESARAEIARLMNGAADLQVPLLVEVGSGLNWDEAH